MQLDHCPVCGGAGNPAVILLEEHLQNDVTVQISADGWRCNECQEEIFDDSYSRKLSETVKRAKQPPQQDDRIFSAQELAQYLRTSENVIYTMVNTGELPGLKVGRSWRFRKAEIDKLFSGRQEQAAVSEFA